MAAKAKTKAAPKAKPKAAKATKAAAKPKAPEKIIEEGSFVKFNGYQSDVSKDEATLTPDEILYIVGSEDEENGLIYNVIKADEVQVYIEDGEDAVNGEQAYPSEISELKGGALQKASEKYMPIVLVGRMSEILEEADGDSIVAAQTMFENVQESYFYMGGALARILQEGSYLKENGGDFDGEDAFNDFCQESFAFKASKARSLARLYTTFSALENFDVEMLSGIGWSLAAKAEKWVTDDNVGEVLDTVSGETQRTVDAVLKEKFSKDNSTPSGRTASRGEAIVTKSFSFKLDEAAGETVQLVLDQCMKENGIENPNLALERICTEWAQDHVQAATAQKRIQGKANKATKAREAREKKAATKPANAKASPKARTKKAA